MNDDSWNIQRVEGGFIVIVDKRTGRPDAESLIGGVKSITTVFTDSAALLNFLHNEFIGSN